MRYIKRVILHNFQSWKDTTIDFSPGLNLLLGTSDAGKSSILRAISFVLYNYPNDDNTIIQHGSTEVEVTIEFSDGVKVTRCKGAGKNSIIGIDSDGNIIEKEKINKEIPEEIKILLGNPPQDDLNGFISYADQFSKMFLVDLSSTDLPRSLSNLTGIEILEESAKQLMQNYKSEEKQIKSDEKEYKKLLEELQTYGYVDECDNKYNILKNKYNSVVDLEKKINVISELMVELDLNITDKDLADCDSVINSINKLLVKIKKIHNLSNKCNKLQIFNLLAGPIVDSDCVEKCLDKINQKLDVVKSHSAEVNVINSLEKIRAKYSEIKESGKTFSSEYKELQQSIETEEHNLSTFKQFLIDEKIQCEVCGGALS